MHGTTENKRGLRAAFRSLLGALLASSPGIASSVSAADEPPMVLAKTGYLFVGGKSDAAVPGSPMTGQMDVEHFIPKTPSHPLPIARIHGGVYTLTSIAAVVIGGTSLMGGAGSPIGSVFGALVLRTIGDLLFVFDLEPLWQPLFQGVILLSAVSPGSRPLLRRARRSAW